MSRRISIAATLSIKTCINLQTTCVIWVFATLQADEAGSMASPDAVLPMTPPPTPTPIEATLHGALKGIHELAAWRGRTSTCAH
eukprot:scaffold32147_cov31-Prasinocladus_malaysianus.AAC.1